MRDPYTPGSGDARYRVTHYALDLDYRPSTNALRGKAELSVQAREATAELVLDLVGLGVDGVRVGGRAARYRHREGRLAVALAEPLAAGGTTSVEVRWSGEPGPRRGPWGEVGWEELTDGVLVAGQPDGAPTWFPCNDGPGEKATFLTTVRTDSAYEVVAHGVLVDRRRGGSRTTWTYHQPDPTAPYLATLQLGRYDRVELAGAPVRQLLLAPADLTAPARHDLARQPDMLRLFTRCFGPFPFGEYTVVVTDDELEIPLEAQGLAVLGRNHVDGRRGSERLVAHELAHSWFGNCVTAARWSDVWLHEGPACYAEWLWSQEAGGPTADALARQHHARLAALPQDLVLAAPGAERMFDDRLYKRGALALHALRRRLGDDAFFALLRSWTAAHRHGTVTTAQFLEHVPAGARPLVSAWVERAPLPALP